MWLVFLALILLTRFTQQGSLVSGGGGQCADQVPHGSSRLISISRRLGWARHLPWGWLLRCMFPYLTWPDLHSFAHLFSPSVKLTFTFSLISFVLPSRSSKRLCTTIWDYPTFKTNSKLLAPAWGFKHVREGGRKTGNAIFCHLDCKHGLTICICCHIRYNLNVIMAARCSNWNFVRCKYILMPRFCNKYYIGVKASDQFQINSRMFFYTPINPPQAHLFPNF